MADQSRGGHRSQTQEYPFAVDNSSSGVGVSNGQFLGPNQPVSMAQQNTKQYVEHMRPPINDQAAYTQSNLAYNWQGQRQQSPPYVNGPIKPNQLTNGQLGPLRPQVTTNYQSNYSNPPITAPGFVGPPPQQQQHLQQQQQQQPRFSHHQLQQQQQPQPQPPQPLPHPPPPPTAATTTTSQWSQQPNQPVHPMSLPPTINYRPENPHSHTFTSNYPQPRQSYPNVNQGYVGGVQGGNRQYFDEQHRLSQQFNNSLSFNNSETIDLLQSRNILPPTPVEPPSIILPTFDNRPSNSSPEIFRCTLTKIPESQSVLHKSRLPLGILIHPFKDLTQLPVIQCNVIVRCRSCRTYINPFVQFLDQRRWKCNLCYRTNELQEEFQYDPISKSYGDPTRRPEIRSATIEFIAPSEYMLRPPQPAVYVFVLDVSFGAVETGYLNSFCQVLLDNLDKLPGDGRTQVAFITFDSAIHFYNLAEGLSQPQMMIVSDIQEIFLPCPDNLLVNLNENLELVKDLLQQLPLQFAQNHSPDNALGAAVEAAFKLASGSGGRVSVFQASLPNVGPGALKPREDPNLRAGKEVPNLGPATDYYKKLSLSCSGQQVAVDLFLLSSQYVDIATLSGISKYSGGSCHYYPGFHYQMNCRLVEKFESDLKRYLTRKIGFEAVMRIRCTKGLAIHTFHGNFFVRSTDLLSLPNINPDAGFAMQMSIEESLNESDTVCFQAALLYTSCKGERRIRVHTLCLPVTARVQEVIYGADQQAIVCLLTKMAVDRSLSSSMSDARDALINACVDAISAFRVVNGSNQPGLLVPPSLKLLPLYILAILKHICFRLGTSTKLDERVFAMNQMKTLPLTQLMPYIYPAMYAVHNLDDKKDVSVPQPPLLPVTSEKFERQGAFLLDNGERMFLYVCQGISQRFCLNIFNVSSFETLPDNLIELPELETTESERLRAFVNHLQSQKPFRATFQVLKSDSKNKSEFLQLLVEDRSESTFSYYEFLKHLQDLITK
ncbi:Protein transport protein Sec24A, variant 2 [Chamberlinius hualienensis]